MKLKMGMVSGKDAFYRRGLLNVLRNKPAKYVL